MKLVMYASVAAFHSNSAGTPLGLSSIVSECQKNNPRNAISGALYFSHGRYLQIIEGESVKIDQLMNNILNDKRHEQCLIQFETKIKRRTFPNWQCQLSMIVSRDPYLRLFLIRYADSLNAMDADAKAAFNHFFKKRTLKRNKEISYTPAPTYVSLDVYGSEIMHLISLPDSSITDSNPLMMRLCDLLVKQPRSVEQLIKEYGEEQRNEILILLKKLNSQGLLQFENS